jgi:hypothetical protein
MFELNNQVEAPVVPPTHHVEPEKNERPVIELVRSNES